MRTVLVIFLVALLPGLAAAQATLRGTVRDSLTRQPLAFASVFLANTTRGTTTDAQGHYALPGVPPGRYELAATYLGYQLRQRPAVVGGSSLALDISLLPAAERLAEVVVRPNPNREADYQRFLELFLGTSTFARQCKVRDPEAVRVDFDPELRRLTATVPHALVVDNLALGYRITFYDLDFQADFADQSVTTTTLSRIVFQELLGNAGRQRRWAAHRLQAYHGSFLHFLRSAYAGRLAEDGFRLQRLQRLPNRRRAAADSLLRARRAAGLVVSQASVPDSVWRLLRQPRVLSFLYTAPLPLDSVRRGQPDGRVWLRFRDLLAVTYERERPDANFHLPGRAPGADLLRTQESVVQLRTPPAAELEPNGVPVVPLSLLTEGYWGFEKMGEFLPLDYQPPATPGP